METELDELRDIAVELRLLGEVKAANNVLYALAALSDAEEPRADLSYSFIMRELRKSGDIDKIREFQKKFKETFEEALDKGFEDSDIDDPAKIALLSVIDQMQLDF